MKMKEVENNVIEIDRQRFASKQLNEDDIFDYYNKEIHKESDDVTDLRFMINKQPSYPVFKKKANE